MALGFVVVTLLIFCNGLLKLLLTAAVVGTEALSLADCGLSQAELVLPDGLCAALRTVGGLNTDGDLFESCLLFVKRSGEDELSFLAPPNKFRPDKYSSFDISDSTSTSFPPIERFSPGSSNLFIIIRPISRPEMSRRYPYPPRIANIPSPSHVLCFLAVNFRLRNGISQPQIPRIEPVVS